MREEIIRVGCGLVMIAIFLAVAAAFVGALVFYGWMLSASGWAWYSEITAAFPVILPIAWLLGTAWRDR